MNLACRYIGCFLGDFTFIVYKASIISYTLKTIHIYIVCVCVCVCVCVLFQSWRKKTEAADRATSSDIITDIQRECFH